jgi:hypothetical protein
MKLHLMLGLACLLVGCSDTVINLPSSPSGTTVSRNGTDPIIRVVEKKVEMRVTGNALSARIRHSNPVDGLTQVITTLPYLVTTRTSSSDLFLSLEATPISYGTLNSYPYLSVQIFVDGMLFREATSNDFTSSTIAVSGTWRQ